MAPGVCPTCQRPRFQLWCNKCGVELTDIGPMTSSYMCGPCREKGIAERKAKWRAMLSARRVYTPVSPAVATALEQFVQRRGWVRVARETKIPVTTLINVIRQRPLMRATYEKATTFARQLGVYE